MKRWGWLRPRRARSVRRQCRADLRQQRLDVLRLHGDDDEAGARDGLGVRERRLDAVPLVQLVGALLPPRGDDDVALLPPARAEQAGDERLADLPAAEDRDPRSHAPSLGGARRWHRYEAARPAGEQIDRRQPRPLAVRREQLLRLPALDAPPASARRGASRARGRRRGRGPSVRGPRERRRRATRGRGRARGAGATATSAGWHVAQPLEVERAAEAHERRPPSGVEAEAPQLGRRERAERLAGTAARGSGRARASPRGRSAARSGEPPAT